MQLSIRDMISIPGGSTNEDRAGACEAWAWVIDGATDVIDAPLTASASDADWFAAAMNEEVERKARTCASLPLSELPNLCASKLAARFQIDAKRAPDGPDEQPSAAAMIVRYETSGLSYVTLGDCALVLETGDGLVHIGDDAEKAGDRWVADAIEEERKVPASGIAHSVREALWPRLRNARRAMNDPEGYGIFSITPTPQHFVRSGTIPVCAPAKGLICSDGLMRLVDVMHRYSIEELFEQAVSRGLNALVDELREIERSDPTCLVFPRAKQFDDTTAILFAIS